MIKRLSLGIFALVAAIAIPALAQQWPNIPIIGGASYCASTVNNTCVSTVPAGPASTGLETIPADTNRAGGASPQTAKIPIALLGGAVQNTAPLTGASIVVSPGIGKFLLNPAGTIAALTVTLPASTLLVDGQILLLATSQTVTTLTLTAGSGTTVNGTNTTLTAAAPLMFVYSAASTTWLKIIL